MRERPTPLNILDQIRAEGPATRERRNPSMPRNAGPKQSVPPTLPPDEAIRLLQRQVDRIDELKTKTHNDPSMGAWESTTISVLNAAFGIPDGEPHENTLEFKR